MFLRILFFCILSTLSFCKLRLPSQASQASLPPKKNQVQPHKAEANSLHLVPVLQKPDPIDASNLKIDSMQVTSEEIKGQAVLRISVTINSRADFIQYAVCPVGAVSDSCPDIFADGQGYFEPVEKIVVGIDSGSYTVFARSCVRFYNSISKQEACGKEWAAQDVIFDASKQNPETKNLLLSREDLEQRMLVTCSASYAMAQSYSLDPKSSDPNFADMVDNFKKVGVDGCLVLAEEGNLFLAEAAADSSSEDNSQTNSAIRLVDTPAPKSQNPYGIFALVAGPRISDLLNPDAYEEGFGLMRQSKRVKERQRRAARNISPVETPVPVPVETLPVETLPVETPVPAPVESLDEMEAVRDKFAVQTVQLAQLERRLGWYETALKAEQNAIKKRIVKFANFLSIPDFSKSISTFINKLKAARVYRLKLNSEFERVVDLSSSEGKELLAMIERGDSPFIILGRVQKFKSTSSNWKDVSRKIETELIHEGSMYRSWYQDLSDYPSELREASYYDREGNFRGMSGISALSDNLDRLRSVSFLKKNPADFNREIEEAQQHRKKVGTTIDNLGKKQKALGEKMVAAEKARAAGLKRANQVPLTDGQTPDPASAKTRPLPQRGWHPRRLVALTDSQPLPGSQEGLLQLTFELYTQMLVLSGAYLQITQDLGFSQP